MDRGSASLVPAHFFFNLRPWPALLPLTALFLTPTPHSPYHYAQACQVLLLLLLLSVAKVLALQLQDLCSTHNAHVHSMDLSDITYRFTLQVQPAPQYQYPIQKATEIYKKSYRDLQKSYRTRDFQLECSISAPVRSSVHRNGTYPTLKTFLRFLKYRSFEGVEAPEGCENVA